MSDIQNQTPDGANPKAADLPVTVHAQYIRDMSFENPGAPDSLRAGGAAPEMDINIGMDARKLKPEGGLPNLFEVALRVTAQAKRGDTVMFIAEIEYGVLVTIGEDVPEDNHHPLLLIEITRLAFPFVRQILSEMTQQGGYPPLYLNPVDFHALYMQRFGDEIRKAQAEAAQAGTVN